MIVATERAGRAAEAVVPEHWARLFADLERRGRAALVPRRAAGAERPLLSFAAEFLTVPFPAWTAVGVVELSDEGSVVEVSCTALVRDARQA